MSVHDERHHAETPDEREALACLATIPVTPPSSAASEAARQAFLRGAAAAPAPRRRIAPLVWTTLALAASLAIIALWTRAPAPSAPWRIDVAPASGLATLDGDAARVGDTFTAGVVQTPSEGMVCLRLGDQLRMDVLASSRVQLHADSLAVMLDEGELQVTSGSLKLGEALAIVTPEARIVLTGTTFAVRRDEVGTCICLYEGSLRIQSDGSVEPPPLLPGNQVQLFSDARAPMVAALPAAELEQLATLHEQEVAHAR